ncbi:hypothetical protein [Streptomyces formicae]|uniref:Integral membrane protein n=1 Tax=Streptomyces formicae TaxID=1616117 RepID=A0ABY3WQQ7_9ACTN|nr:hypothetical protein [Streptomyces formicae]UNM12875.1 hypothetical protein J4032_16340 [Streptomyces formicae]
MGKFFGAVLAVVGAAGALILAHAVGAPPAVVLGAAVGVLALLWLLVLLTVPWNLYFRAHAVLAEIAVSREKGIAVSAARDAEARRIARTMLRTAVAGHVLTAGGVVAVTMATGQATGYWFAGFFLLSTLFRPAGAYFTQLRRRLGLLLKDVTHPRDDVVELRTRVDRVEAGMTVLEGKAEEQYRALAELRRTADALGVASYERADDADRRIAALGREFESTVNRLTDDQEIIAGVKAFLRLLRASGDGLEPARGPRPL